MKRFVDLLLMVFTIYIFYSCSNEVNGTSSSTSSSSSMSYPSVIFWQTFESNVGDGFEITRGTPLEGNGELTNIDGIACVKICALADVNPHEAYAVEVKWNLPSPADFSSTNYIMDFDFYLPAESYNFNLGLQFAFHNWENKRINSAWWVASLAPDVWKNYKALIRAGKNTQTGFIDYSELDSEEYPYNWTNFIDVRIQYVVSQKTNITFYIGKIVITNKNQ